MLSRILRSTIVFAIVVVAYQAYVLLAVPRLEPPLALKEKQRVGEPASGEPIGGGLTKYQRLLSNYFPTDHWSLVGKPKIFTNGTEQVMLVIDNYTRRPVGTGDEDTTQVDISQFAMLMFPTPPHGDVAAPRDAIILEAQQGARLLFDDFHPELGRIGQITQGVFPGPIRIRSDMHDPGPEDDLLVETSDLQMNTKLLYTAKPVRFRMGQTVGGGQELEVRFLANEHTSPKDNSLKIAGFDSLEIRREVRMRMQLDASSMLTGNDKPAKTKPTQPYDVAKKEPAKPIDVTCNGPFTFDFVRYVASVDRDVVVRQLNADGPADQLNCNQLDIHFAPRPALPSDKDAPVVVDPSKRQNRELGRLEAAAIVALGHPAVAVSPSKRIEARGDRIHIALRERRLRIEGGNDTRLTSGPNVLQAPIIDYQQPEEGAESQIGKFRATGPGSLHFVMDEKRPDQIFHSVWQGSVQLGREKGQPVIVMEGRPELAFASAGSLIGDQIRLYLRELDGKSPTGFAVGGGSGKEPQAKLAPDRLIAVGRVEIASPQMAARTQQLQANFQIAPELAAPPTNADGQPAPSGKPAQSTPANKPSTKPSASPSQPPAAPKNTPSAPSEQSYQVVADQMRLEVLVKGQTAVPTTLACEGNIIVRGVPQPGDTQQPIEIRGQQVLVDKLDTKTPHITLKGTNSAAANPPAGGGASNQPAQLSGRGVTLLVDTIEADGRDSHMWSDGPGEAVVLMARDLQGNATASPTPVKVHWQNGLRFDGQTIAFDENVVVASADSTLKCDRLLAKLAAPIQFGQRMDQAVTSLSQIDCVGRVAIENLSRDLGGVNAHDRMELGHLTINQQTGEVRGQGPGIIRSTRYGAGAGLLTGLPDGKSSSPPAAANAPGSKLYFLRVDFRTGLEGNIYTRMLTFHDRVRTVYGPVDAWGQELDPLRPETLPPDSMTLSCDHLQLNEDPAATKSAAAPNSAVAKAMGKIQLVAQSNVKIDGQSPSQGQFTVQADSVSYDQGKELFILQGDARTPAKLWRRTATGDSPPLEAEKIFYNRATGQVKAQIQYLEITPGDLNKAMRQPATAPQTK